MKIKESYIVDKNPIVYSWSSNKGSILKGKYKHEYVSDEIKVYKLSKEEMNDYLKVLYKK